LKEKAAMAIQIDASALIATCKNGMTCAPSFIFWGICLLAVIGLYQSVVLWRKEKEPEVKDWRKTKAPTGAPEGFKWVLVPLSDD
jgi:hypothetical protein